MLQEMTLAKTSVDRQVQSENNTRRRTTYARPSIFHELPLGSLLDIAGRSIPKEREGLFRKPEESDPIIFYSGDLAILKSPCVSVIGARDVSAEGGARASRISRELAIAGVVVVSGLAKGVDAAAHMAAIAAGGKTIAVIGTSIDKAYPVENASLQEEIYNKHLLISQFHFGQRTYPSDFPKRNRLMAALSDGSVIVEASDTSGTLHQASECVRLGRWLFLLRSVVENDKLTWPSRFLHYPKTVVVTNVQDVLSRVL